MSLSCKEYGSNVCMKLVHFGEARSVCDVVIYGACAVSSLDVRK
jgi:hypothetical protein